MLLAYLSNIIPMKIVCSTTNQGFPNNLEPLGLGCTKSYQPRTSMVRQWKMVWKPGPSKKARTRLVRIALYCTSHWSVRVLVPVSETRWLVWISIPVLGTYWPVWVPVPGTNLATNHLSLFIFIAEISYGYIFSSSEMSSSHVGEAFF